MASLVIIGNGFDLAHGMKTSYNDFADHYIQKFINGNCPRKLLGLTPIGIEQTGEFKSVEQFRQKMGKPNYYTNDLFASFIINQTIGTWCDVEEMYFEELRTIAGSENSWQHKDLRITPFHENFEIIRKYLEEYLSGLELKPLETYKQFFKKFDSEDHMILNFNYTSLVQEYLRSGRAKVNNIHGALNNESNPIVFGYAVDNNEKRELLDSEGNEFVRYIKSHIYQMSDGLDLLNTYLDLGRPINVSILGHAIGMSDKNVLKNIFNHENVESIRIYYYNKEGYRNQFANIDRVMNNDDNLYRVINFKNSIGMPQFDNDEGENKSFLKEILKVHIY